MYQYSVMLKENVDINKFIVDKIDIKASSEAMGVILDNIGSNMSFPIKFIAAIFIEE
jgi:hypothetical protein